MRHGSLFSGIGGFDLAAEWMGWENVFHCEWNEFGQKILKHYWPNAKSYGDITKTDFTEWRGKVDIVSGGFPCQPYSQAGKRKGKADDRHLWPEMLRAIREIQPRWVVGENVPGLLNWERGMVLDEIKADLEAAGFEVFPSLVLPACGKNAPHRRDRLWIVAHAIEGRQRELQTIIAGEESKKIGCKDSCGLKSIISNGNATNSDNDGQQRSNSKNEINASERGFDALNDTKQTIASHSSSGRISGYGRESEGQQIQTAKFNKNYSKQFRRMEWEKFPTQPPVCGGNDGLSSELAGITISKHRKESLMAYGNSIVPQIVFEIFKAIEEYERIITTTK